MILFLHGQESSSQGSKAQLLRKLLPGIVTPDFTGEFPERMGQLRALVEQQSDLTLIGSSLGGLMAAYYTVERPEKISRLILLAPAVGFEETRPFFENAQPLELPVTIYHGTRDDVVPLDPVREIAERLFLHLDFNIVDDDHRLMKTSGSLDWPALVLARKGA